jgi:hypothetical protein
MAQDKKYYKTIFSLDYGNGDFAYPIIAMLEGDKLSISIDMGTYKSDGLALYYDEEELIVVRRRLALIADRFESLLNTNNNDAGSIPIVLPKTEATWYISEEKDVDIDINVKFVTLYSKLNDSTKCIIIKCDLSDSNSQIEDQAFWVFISPQEIRDLAKLLDPTILKSKCK